MYDFNRIYEASINGAYEYEDGTKSGRALAYDEHDGIRDVTEGSKGRGQAEVDKSGVYLGVPYGKDSRDTAWVNPTKAEDISPHYGSRARIYQSALENASPKEKKSLEDWAPENPDLGMVADPLAVRDNINGNILPVPEGDGGKNKEPFSLKGLFTQIFDSSNKCA